METEEELIGKFKNIFIMLLYGIISNDIDKVKQFLSDDLALKFSKIIENNINNNEVQMYDELNVKDLLIESITEDDSKIVKASLIARYIPYIIDKETGNYKRGIKDHRIENKVYLTFSKKINGKERQSVIKCPGCGANMDINFHGKCSWCGTTIDVEQFDYKLIEIKGFGD